MNPIWRRISRRGTINAKIQKIIVARESSKNKKSPKRGEKTNSSREKAITVLLGILFDKSLPSLKHSDHKKIGHFIASRLVSVSQL